MVFNILSPTCFVRIVDKKLKGVLLLNSYRDSLDLLTKVKYREQGGEEEEWRVLESVVNYWLLAIYNQIFKATDHLLGAPLDLTPYTLHLTFSYFEPGGKWGKKSSKK